MTYTPVYCRAPNKFIKYENRHFDDGYGHTGITRIAIYLDKKCKLCEVVAQIIWSKKMSVPTGYTEEEAKVRNLQLHEELVLLHHGLRVIRVINGWIYIVVNIVDDSEQNVFVPEKL